MAAGAVWRVDMIGVGNTGEELVTSLHYVESTASVGLAPADANLATQGVEGALITDYLGCATGSYTYLETLMTSVTGYSPPVQGVSNVNFGSVGLAVGPDGPIERALLVRKHTAAANRTGRGRCFLPMPPADWFLSDGQVDTTGGGPAAAAAWITVMKGVRNPIVGLELIPCLFNRLTLAFLVLTGGSLSPLVGAQRRRRFGVGS